MNNVTHHLARIWCFVGITCLSLISSGCISFVSGDSIKLANGALAINSQIQQMGQDNGVGVGLAQMIDPGSRTEIETILVDAQSAANEVESLKQQAEDVLDENFQREDRRLMIKRAADSINNQVAKVGTSVGWMNQYRSYLHTIDVELLRLEDDWQNAQGEGSLIAEAGIVSAVTANPLFIVGVGIGKGIADILDALGVSPAGQRINQLREARENAIMAMERAAINMANETTNAVQSIRSELLALPLRERPYNWEVTLAEVEAEMRQIQIESLSFRNMVNRDMTNRDVVNRDTDNCDTDNCETETMSRVRARQKFSVELWDLTRRASTAATRLENIGNGLQRRADNLARTPAELATAVESNARIRELGGDLLGYRTKLRAAIGEQCALPL